MRWIGLTVIGAMAPAWGWPDPVKGTIAADRAYSTMKGFPDDSAGTEFGKFCDVAFSTRGTEGMGLQQLWWTPSIFQTPKGAMGKRYEAGSWSKLEFRMYESDPLPKERYLAKEVETPRGRTVAMLEGGRPKACGRRAHREVKGGYAGLGEALRGRVGQ